MNLRRILAVAHKEWREVLRGSPITTPSVTTRGPALIVAWWWGDAGVDSDKTAVADNGFTVIDGIAVGFECGKREQLIVVVEVAVFVVGLRRVKQARMCMQRIVFFSVIP